MTDVALTPLREDLSLSPGPVTAGAPTWTLYDPARHRYMRLGWLDFEILARWHLRTPAAIVRALGQETTLRATEEDVARLALFARGAGLLKASAPADVQRLAAMAVGKRRSLLAWLIHNYLFIRIRLVDPDRFLTALMPVVRPLFGWGGVAAILLLGLLGLLLISREWEAYTHSLVEQYTVEGLLGMAVALSVSKVFHELGHGFAAKRYGCRVSSMGVAFLVLWPVLWTDTTDGWRLTDRRQRLAIDVAGVMAEIAVAAVASIAWAILPDAPARSAAFVLSSTTWILTLFVNVVPLLRFDGYYVLSDLLDVANLQERGFAYARWWLRELLFRPGAPVPEPLSPALARILLVYAFSSWIYRLIVFGGIALLVYHLTFKALGIVLAAIEIWFFIARPIVRELAVWAEIVSKNRPNLHSWVTLTLVVLLLSLLFVPWRGRVDAPALLKADKQVALLAAEPGRLAFMVEPHTPVREGQDIFLFESVDISHSLDVARAQLEVAQAEYAVTSFNPDKRRAQQASYARISEVTASLSRAEARAANLRVRAPFAGTLKDVPPDLRIADDVRRGEKLGILIASDRTQVEAYVAEPDLDRVHVGAGAKLILIDGRVVPLVVQDIAHASTRSLDVPELASTNEGPIAVRRGPSSTLVPDRSIYRVVLSATNPAFTATTRLVGRVAIDAPARSAADLIYRKTVALLLRESAL